PYVDQAERMFAAIRDAKAQAAGREAILVSHQLPIWVVRRTLEGLSMLHDPRRRNCTLASVTSLTFDGARSWPWTTKSPAAACYRTLPWRCCRDPRWWRCLSDSPPWR